MLPEEQRALADGQRIDMTPTPAAMRHMTAALREQIERSRATIAEAQAVDESGELNFLNDNYSGFFPHTLYVLEEALSALIEREEARIARIESVVTPEGQRGNKLADLS